MASTVKYVMLINLAVVILQICVLFFQINRWNEILGSIFSIVICLMGYFPATIGENRERWFISLYSFMLGLDLLGQIINLILLICLEWVVIQYCLHVNVSLDISYYGGIACYDWWHFDYGQINHRDRAMIVTILLAIVVALRVVQLVLTCAKSRPTRLEPLYFLDSPQMYAPDDDHMKPPQTSRSHSNHHQSQHHAKQYQGARAVSLSPQRASHSSVDFESAAQPRPPPPQPGAKVFYGSQHF